MAKGIEAYYHSQFGEAARCFEDAVKLDPTSADARISLAVAYLGVHILGFDSAGNPLAHNEEESLLKALEIDPRNKFALGFLAALYYEQAQGRPLLSEKIAKLSDVEGLQRRIVDLDPNSNEAYYMLGVIAWCKSYFQMSTRLAGLGTKAEGRSPLPDAGIREALRASVGDQIDDGIKQLSRAVEIDANYADAMNYLSHLLREKATLSEGKSVASGYVRAADEWDVKATKIRKKEKKEFWANRAKGLADAQAERWPPLPWVSPPPPPPAR
jgi:tetratricopeptide (TPR) repeat protein